VSASPVLVTGATGCLGSHLVEELLDGSGAPVRALVRPSSDTGRLEGRGVEILRGSLLDPGDLAAAVDGVEVVYHLGGVVVDDNRGESPERWRQIEETNIGGTIALARTAQAAGVRRFVFCSSVRIFGFGNQLLWPEDGTRTGSDLYSRGKAEAEEALLELGRQTGLEIVNVRPRFIYGDRDRYVLPKLVDQVRRGRVPMVGGHTICDLVYARDCATAIVLASTGPGAAGESYNITSGECLSLREILLEVAAALGQEIRFVGLPAPAVIGAAAALELGARVLRRTPPITRDQLRWYLNDHHFSIAKARSELGYEPRYPLARALAEIDLQQFLETGSPS